MGDGEAFDSLVRRLRGRIEQWARKLTGDPDDAADVTQIVLVKLHERIDRFSGKSTLTTWLYRVTRNVAVDTRRRNTRRAALLAKHAASFATIVEADDGARDAVAAQLAAAIRDRYESLPPRQREVFRMADLEGRPTAEIARELGIEEVTVRVTLSNARRAIRELMMVEQRSLVEDYES